MLRWVLCLFTVSIFTNIYSQVTANDSVSLNAGTTDMVFYDLSSGQKTVTSNTDWDIALSVRPTQFPNAPLGGTTIRINEANGVKVYYVPNADAASFNTLDTTGFHSWRQLHDSDSTMDEGALNSNRNKGNFFDFGWGVYSQVTHNVTGDSLYLFELPNGEVKKFIVENLVYDTAYNLKYANIDNSGLQNVYVKKKDYQGRNFAYLNLSNNQVINKEPLASTWQLLFTRYAATNVIPDTTYPVVGVLGNTGTVVAARNGVPTASNDDSGLTNSGNFNSVGWAWKYFDFPSSTYNIVDSLSYFVQTAYSGYYKLVFTGYNSSTGVVSFYKETLNATGVNEVKPDFISSVYPNPCSDVINAVFSSNEERTIEIYNLQGSLLSSEVQAGSSAQLSVSNLASGSYLLRVTTGGLSSTQRFIISR